MRLSGRSFLPHMGAPGISSDRQMVLKSSADTDPFSIMRSMSMLLVAATSTFPFLTARMLAPWEPEKLTSLKRSSGGVFRSR